MAIKDAFFVSQFVERQALALFALSFVYATLSTQAVRLAVNRVKAGAFPITWLFCLTVLFEVFCRCGVLFAADSLATGRVFDEFRPFVEKHKDSMPFGTLLMFTWRTLGIQEIGNLVVLRIVIAASAFYYLINRMSHGSGATLPEKTTYYRIASMFTLLVFAVQCSLIGVSCSHTFFEHPVPLNPSLTSLTKVSQNMHMCVKGHYGAGDALITIAMVHASLAWTKGSWLGFQHVLALRWVGAVAHLWSIHLQTPIPQELANPSQGLARQVEIFATMTQVGLVALLFMPKFAVRQPLSFLLVINLVGAISSLCVGFAPMPIDAMHKLGNSLGLATVFFSFLAVFLSGGVGISLAMFCVVLAAQVHAPWLRQMLQ